MIGGQGDADDFTNTVIDDDLAFVASEDLMQSLIAAAPFTGDWLPAFNSPFCQTLPTTQTVSHDPVGPLGRLDVTSTLGTWSANVSDGAATNTGTLASWAILVTPRAFACTLHQGLRSDDFESGSILGWQ